VQNGILKIKTSEFKIDELKYMKKSPEDIFYIGNKSLLKNNKVSIVGTRRPNGYTKLFTREISSKLSKAGFTVVSGAAMGVDALAHAGAGESNTIAVAGTGLDIRYPSVNNKLIENIEKKGLVLSLFEKGTPPSRYSFPIRNELVVSLGGVLIVTQADKNSGTMRSVEFAKKMGKKIYVLPHRLEESPGTQQLLEKGEAEAIYDINNFIQKISGKKIDDFEDEFLEFCKSGPLYDEVVEKYPKKLFEYELSGKIKVENGIVLNQY
jgi:DNA processing protein